MYVDCVTVRNRKRNGERNRVFCAFKKYFLKSCFIINGQYVKRLSLICDGRGKYLKVFSVIIRLKLLPRLASYSG